MRAGRRGGDRGARGVGTQSRGSSTIFRSNSNGTPRTNGDTSTPTMPSKRGQRGDRGHRGGTSRGGGNMRGSDQGLRGNNRGRGGHMHTTTGASTAISNTTPHAQDEYLERLKFLKEERSRQRAQFIREGRMNPEGQIHLNQAVKIVGICADMCPEFERVRRIVEDDLKPPEFTPESRKLNDRKSRVPDESRMVKAYQRSAAGMDAELISDIRPPSVCLKTMKYMIERIDSEGIPSLHGWLWDRTRAVRKDLRTQAVDRQEDILIYLQCFEQCARLHLLSLHQMANSDNEDYSYQQDVEQLIQTNISLRQRYGDNRRTQTISPNEAEFQAYRLIINLQHYDNKVEGEINNLPESLRRNPRMQIAIQLYRAGSLVIWDKGATLGIAHQNWRAFWKLLASPAVSYLMACAAELVFNKVRYTVLDTLHRVYRQGGGKAVEDWTLSQLLDVLGFDTGSEVVEYCGLFGFTFVTPADGEPYLDINSVAFTGSLQKPDGIRPQTFSRKFVESKRFNRLLSAVIKGMSVSEARTNGFVVESGLTGNTEAEPKAQAEDSLFIPDDSTTKPADLASASGGSGFPSGGPADPSSKLSPFANPFNPSSAPAVQPSVAHTGPSPFTQQNPFQTSSNTATSTSNPFATGSGSTLFSQSSFGKPSGFINPSSPATPVANATASTAAQTITPGIFDPSKGPIKFATATTTPNTFSSPRSGSPFAPPSTTDAPSKAAEQPTSQSLAPWSFSSTASTEDKPEAAASTFQGFATAGSVGSTTPQVSSSAPSTPFSSFTAAPGPSATPSNFATANNVASAHEEEQQKAQEEQQRRAREEQERRAREEQERRARAEQERRAQEEGERLVRQEQQRRAREEQQRAAEQRKRREEKQREADLAWDTLTRNVFLDPEEGLLGQFVEQQVRLLLPGIAETVGREKAEKKADEHRQRKKTEWLRSLIWRWRVSVEKKKRAKHARSRRKRLRENADQLMAIQTEDITNLAMIEDHVNARPNDFKKPVAPASAQRVGNASRAEQRSKKEKKRSVTRTANGVSNGGSNVDFSQSASRSNGISPQSSFSASSSTTTAPYRNSTAPIDRTETDWFKLRAMGIDPSKYRKRSHDSDSDEEEEDNDRKRARTSTSSVPRVSPRASVARPRSTTEDDLFARFRAVREALDRPANASTPRSTRQSPIDTNAIIARGRAFISAGSTPQNSPPNVQHDSGRNAPDLGLRHSGANRSSLGKSQPAYRSRRSFFVDPPHYGNPDAILSLQQSRGSNNASTSVKTLGPLELSSPIPTQQSYVPETQREYVTDAESDEGEDMEEEFESGVEYETDEEQDYEEEYEEMEEYGLTYEQNAQEQPGATQDDAIELSD